MGDHNPLHFLYNAIPWVTVLFAAWGKAFPIVVTLIVSLLAGFWYCLQIWDSGVIRRWRRGNGWPVPAHKNEDY